MTVIRKGKDALPKGGSGKFLQIPEGESVTFTALAGLDDLVSVDQHAFWDQNPAVIVPCVGTDCPACDIGNKSGFKAFLPVLTKEDGPKIYSFGISVLRQLEVLEEELGSLVGQVLKVKRHGSGLSTKYTVVAIGKKISIKDIELPDVIEAIGPTTREEIIKVMVDGGLIDAPKKRLGKPAPEAKSKSKAKPAKDADETEESESWDDDDSDTDWDEA